MLQEINDHISKGAFEKVVENPPIPSVVVRPDERPIALESSIEQVWSCIVDKDVMGIIGIYGLGGVGKTTLLTQINNKFSTTPNGFNVVIWAVVSKDYDVGKKIKPEEAWKLFQDKVGDENLNSHPDIWELAKQVAERCGGLPLAVITMGCAMACKTTPVEWKYAIEKLKRSSLTKMKNEEGVNYLKNQMLRHGNM
ncbi:hypothetical protein GOBAR_DD14443 [Gossypium barbadense]|nr:hypothetical protein GOBAR_DD14443 [Gossypium barbadense]